MHGVGRRAHEKWLFGGSEEVVLRGEGEKKLGKREWVEPEPIN